MLKYNLKFVVKLQIYQKKQNRIEMLCMQSEFYN